MRKLRVLLQYLAQQITMPAVDPRHAQDCSTPGGRLPWSRVAGAGTPPLAHSRCARDAHIGMLEERPQHHERDLLRLTEHLHEVIVGARHCQCPFGQLQRWILDCEEYLQRRRLQAGSVEAQRQ